jgi:long-chain acyl-CoA synthetase
MAFLDQIFARLKKSSAALVIQEVRDGKMVAATGGEFLRLVQQARFFFSVRGLKKGDRCALIAPNGIQWAAIDLAMMAEGLIVVPMYVRQAPSELVAMLKDSSPARIICSDANIAAEIKKQWPGAPTISLEDSVFVSEEIAPEAAARPPLADADVTTIIYTSGTSGEAKGVMLTSGNVTHMVGCTNAHLDRLMGTRTAPDKIFHYLPFCFAGSWILLLTALSRHSVLTLSMDLSKLADELKLAEPDYFLNVPTLLERVRAKILEAVTKKGGFAARMFSSARDAYTRQAAGTSKFPDSLWLGAANKMMFPAIRQNIGTNLKAIICGSAPLAIETQRFFMMVGIPVLQVYGLTETTAICTMDDPSAPEPGRVGSAISGVEMKVGDNQEILVRGPNIFLGYWKKPLETETSLVDGWFRTGDQGDVNEKGNWRITGRIKNLIILNSGHNVAPEPIEEALADKLPEAGHVVLIGNQRSYIAALVTATGPNALNDARVQSVLEAVNAGAPHYKQIRGFQIIAEAFTIENGLLTANGKLRRDAIAGRYANQIEALYQKKTS